MKYLFFLFIGLMVGLHNATWGMYKDAPHEGFSWATYFRSVIAGLIYAPLLAYFFHFEWSIPNGLVIFGAAYALERITMEVYKTFIRVEDQSKYFIPMQLSAFGKPVTSYPARLALGAAYVGVILLIAFGLYKLNISIHDGNITISPYILLLICSVFGWVSAFGGAWKDAPLEGFETFKFFRSPFVAYCFAFLAALFTSNLILIAMCSIGFTVASIETYKTFFFLDRPRGKFQGKPILYPENEEFRKKFVPLYVGIWIMVIAMIIYSLMHRTDSLFFI